MNGILDLCVGGVKGEIFVIKRPGSLWRWFRRSRRRWKRGFVCLTDAEEGNSELRICWDSFEDCAVYMLEVVHRLSSSSVLTF